MWETVPSNGLARLDDCFYLGFESDPRTQHISGGKLVVSGRSKGLFYIFLQITLTDIISGIRYGSEEVRATKRRYCLAAFKKSFRNVFMLPSKKPCLAFFRDFTGLVAPVD